MSVILAHKIALEPSYDQRYALAKAAGCARVVYKLLLHCGKLVVADRVFAFSKICSVCGAVKKNLSLKHRTFTCDICVPSVNCGLNVAINLRTLGLRETNARGHCVRLIGDFVSCRNGG